MNILLNFDVFCEEAVHQHNQLLLQFARIKAQIAEKAGMLKLASRQSPSTRDTRVSSQKRTASKKVVIKQKPKSVLPQVVKKEPLASLFPTPPESNGSINLVINPDKVVKRKPVVVK